MVERYFGGGVQLTKAHFVLQCLFLDVLLECLNITELVSIAANPGLQSV
jgi:hypothetical protein